MPIKVLEIIPELSTGGAEQVVVSYLEQFKDDSTVSARAVVFSGNKSRLWEKYASEKSLPVDYLNIPDDENGEFDALKVITELRRYLIHCKPDVIHAHMQFVKKICLASLFLPIKARYQTIHSDVGKLYSRKEAAEERLFKKAAGMKTICLTESMAAEAGRLFGRNAFVLRNGIDLKKYKTGAGKEYRTRFGFDDNNIVFGHVGRFHTVKNHELLIKAFSQVYSRNKLARLVLIGTGELMEGMKTLCGSLGSSEAVLFLGERGDVPELLQMMDLFVFPSFFEGFPISLLEAQAAGLACLVSENISEEVLVSKKIRRLSPEADDIEWARSMEDYSEYEYIPQYDINNYSIDAVIKQLKDLYTGT